MSERAKITTKVSESKSYNPVSKIRKTDFSQSPNSPIDQILHLQRTIGNQAVQRLFKTGAIQAKLKIGKPGDIYEQEADRIAEQIMRMPELSVERKPPGPKGNPLPVEEEGAILWTKGTDVYNSGISPYIESNLSSVRNSGHLLPESARSFFEPRFGYDFRSVRVHTDPEADSLASSINAKAFTAGKDIVFGSGEYAPETTEGKRLMAHELTHVLQQESSSEHILQRSTPESFRVTGLYEDRSGYPDDVFFDFDQPSLSSSAPENELEPAEAEKARNFSRRMTAGGIPDINLYGYASEEGNRAYNQRLAEKRIEAVANLLIDEGYDGVIYHVPLLRKSAGQIDYRFWRSVEMKPDSAASSRTGSTASHTQPCEQGRQDIIREVRDRVVPMLNDSVQDLDTYRATLPSNPQNRVRIALDNNFANDHSAATALEVRNRLEAMSDFLTQPNFLTTILKCADSEEPTCRSGGWAAANPSELMVCPIFFTAGDGKEEVLVHESAHGSRFQVHDRAYAHEKVFVFLTRDQAIDNAQSLTFFVFELRRNQRPLYVGPAQPDVVTGCDPTVTNGMGPNEEKVRWAVAWAERWNTYAIFGVAQTYGNTNNENYMRPYFYRWFRRGDRPAMAGIYDRYRQMGQNFENQLTISCVSNQDSSCSAGGFCTWILPSTVLICPRFLPLDELRQIIKIYAALARLMPGVTEDQTEAYPGLAKDYKEHFWGVIG